MQTIKVQVNFIRYKKESTGGGFWYVLDTDQGKCSGSLPYEPRTGERLELQGDYTVWMGQTEFKFKISRPDVPEDYRMMLHYVCERTNGIGPKKEEEIWQVLGREWPELKPGDVPRLRDEVINEFLANYRDMQLHDEQYKAISWLRGLGCGHVMAAGAWEKWSSEVVGVVNSNCYELTRLPGVGFKTVDATVRQGLKIGDHDPRRIRAGIAYAVEEAAEGGTAVPFSAVLRMARELLDCDKNIIVTTAGSMICAGDLVVFDGEIVATKKDFEFEDAIWIFGGCNECG